MTRLPTRMKASYDAREHNREEVPWVRTRDLAKADLPRPIAVVNGAFDVLHSGHMKVLFAARARAKTVIVAMDSDERCGRKGAGHPIQSWVERAVTMNYMPVDYLVEIEKDTDMTRLLATVRPDLRVQGFDYRGVPSKYNVRKCFVRGPAMRTSEIIRRCKVAE